MKHHLWLAMALLQSGALSALPKPRVAFLGPLGSFSHEAAVASFGSEATILPQASFQDAFAALQANESDYAAIPLENSSNGAVVQVLDLLADRKGLYGDVAICGEHYLPVHHCLLVKKADGGQTSPPPVDITTDPRYEAITKLYTHPQAWGQCEAFLSKYFKGVERQDVSATSKAAEIISKEPGNSSAAIASRFAAEQHGVDILAENIEDDSENTTRFLLFRNRKSDTPKLCGHEDQKKPDESDKNAMRKALISFTIDHSSPGALANALFIFKKFSMNLTAINSRPSGIRPWQYIFFVECQGPAKRNDRNVEKIMAGLTSVTHSSQHLGSWDDMLGSN
ncbi:prephenate dehydratase [Coccidioides posadasii str. Silveira]|nr:prephenate dehydratase, putative [Coccidioides posadasii C735 delta SOWgp]EER27543.1 prephenate dehydratase, putative [Coccidioides posadasii C735 delta SOWgp]KMM67399.1 prephenate dehydratase family protein [Coccidioides posadasii RMSCC 3488]QVM11732.1 prephenate dehydratase [Coccidioides posadasii str. Silveira]|eukprot:XP_003069688.1 prephenate dehydratase, putative [Coccidioides posadasii C735 delta SOWgp]